MGHVGCNPLGMRLEKEAHCPSRKVQAKAIHVVVLEDAFWHVENPTTDEAVVERRNLEDVFSGQQPKVHDQRGDKPNRDRQKDLYDFDLHDSRKSYPPNFTEITELKRFVYLKFSLQFLALLPKY
jgi:hypothetical protein